MSFDSFMGGATDSFKDDGFITITSQEDDTKPNPKMKNFGNTEMAEFKKGASAFKLTNDPYTTSTFGIGSLPTPVGVASAKNTRLGHIDWKSSETLLIGGAFFGMGILASVLFNRYYK